jgi:hypothetical protein
MYAPAPDPGVMPNPYDYYAYESWPEEVWTALAGDQEAYWFHFMLWKNSIWTEEEWAQFRADNPEVDAYITEQQVVWHQGYCPGSDMYEGPTVWPSEDVAGWNEAGSLAAPASVCAAEPADANEMSGKSVDAEAGRLPSVEFGMHAQEGATLHAVEHADGEAPGSAAGEWQQKKAPSQMHGSVYSSRDDRMQPLEALPPGEAAGESLQVAPVVPPTEQPPQTSNRAPSGPHPGCTTMHILAPHQTFDSRGATLTYGTDHSASPQNQHLASIQAPHHTFSSRNLNVATNSNASTPLTPRAPPLSGSLSSNTNIAVDPLYDSFLGSEHRTEDLMAMRKIVESITGSPEIQNGMSAIWRDPDEVLAEIDIPNQAESDLMRLLAEKGQRMLDEHFSEDSGSEVRVWLSRTPL